ncbi:hypothetical protein [Micromonospora sp. NPDC005413]|uniref:hypothetical protein n=1 Tax=Micromonospora sp. NPDC005413 TaxID=3154563 RepID=UPI0033A93B8F
MLLSDRQARASSPTWWGSSPPAVAAAGSADAAHRTMVYGLAAIDISGRIADRTIIRALGWAPGTRLHIREGSGVIVVRLDRQGVFTVTGQGHLHLPSAVRHWCGLTAGGRVLLAANPPEGLLVVHPPAALDAMVVAVHAGVLGGGQE